MSEDTWEVVRVNDSYLHIKHKKDNCTIVIPMKNPRAVFWVEEESATGQDQVLSYFTANFVSMTNRTLNTTAFVSLRGNKLEIDTSNVEKLEWSRLEGDDE